MKTILCVLLLGCGVAVGGEDPLAASGRRHAEAIDAVLAKPAPTPSQTLQQIQQMKLLQEQLAEQQRINIRLAELEAQLNKK